MAIKKYNEFILEDVKFTTEINNEALKKIKEHTKTTLLRSLSNKSNENYEFYEIEDLIENSKKANIDAKKLISELSTLIIKHFELLWPNIKDGKSAEAVLLLVINDIKKIIEREIKNISWTNRLALKASMKIKFGSKEKYISESFNSKKEKFGFGTFKNLLSDLVDSGYLTQPENRFISQDKKDVSRINKNKYDDNNDKLFDTKVPQWYKEILGTIWDAV